MALGHVFWDENSASTTEIFEQSYNAPDIVDKLWKYISNTQEFKMKLKI